MTDKVEAATERLDHAALGWRILESPEGRLTEQAKAYLRARTALIAAVLAEQRAEIERLRELLDTGSLAVGEIAGLYMDAKAQLATAMKTLHKVAVFGTVGGWFCRCCGETWGLLEKEAHKPDCILAPREVE